MGTPLRVLIVEDSEEDTLLIIRELKRGGFDPIHERVETAEAMKAALSTKTWDLILADYSMPHFSGLEAMKLFKESGLDLPFIIVSGSIGEDVAVEAMKSGAHDYLMKNNLARLVPSIQQELHEAEVRRKLKVSQNALQESEKRYRQVVENATEIIYTVDVKGNFTYGNPAGLKVTGYSLHDLRELNYMDLVVPDHRERVSQAYINQFRERRPTSYIEFPFFNKSGEIIWFGQNTSLVIEDGKVVGFHIIARDITERKQAEERLQERERYFRTLMYTLHEDIVVIDCDYRITDVNNTFLITTGKSREKAIGKHCYEISHGYTEPCDRHGEQCLFGEVFETGKSRNCKHVHMRGDGSKVHVDILLSPLKDDSGSVTHVVEAVRDVTDLVQAYEALKESEEKYRLLVENANEAIFVIQDGMLRFFNIKNIELIGYSKEELTSTPFINFVHPDDREVTIGRYLKRIRGEEPSGVNVLRIIDKAGNIKWAEVNSVLISWEGRPATLNFLNDVTEHKQAEEALRISEEKYRTILETIEEGYYEVDLTGNFTFFNDSLCRMMGYTKDELMGMNNRQYMDEETAKKVYEVFSRLYATGEPYEAFDWEIIRKDGTKRFHDSSVSLIRNEKGEGIGFRGIARDITERKKAEESLRESEKRFKLAAESSSDLIYEWDIKERVDWFGKIDELLGYVPNEFPRTFEAWTNSVHPDDRDRVITAVKNHLEKNEPYDIEYRVRRKDGTYNYWWVRGTAVGDEKGNPYRWVGAVTDITQRKRAEEALHSSENKYRTLIENVPQKIFLKDKNSVYISCNKSYAQDLKIKPDEISGRTDCEFYPKELAEKYRADDKKIIERGKTEEIEEKYIQNGQEVWVNTIKTPVKDEKGNILGILGIFWDITDRKRAEESLKQSEENARQFAQENAIMAEIGRIISSTLNIDEVYESFSKEVKKIIFFDRIVINYIDTDKGTVRNVYMAGKGLQDRNVKDIYPLEGSGNAEMVRTRSTLLIQTKDFNEYKDRFPMLLSTFQAGFRSIMNVPLFSKGKIIGGLLLRSLKPYAYTDKEVRLAERIGFQIAGAIANAQLYTERIQAESERAALQEQLRQSQKMEAIGQLAGGVAHDFNNLLTVIKGYSQLSLTEMKKEDPLKENIEEIKKSADRAADLTRQLLAFSRRQVMEMKVLDLNDLLRNLDKLLRRVIGEDIELTTILEENLGRAKTDPGQIEQVIMNLAVNARDAMSKGGKLTIETANVELDQAYARAHVAVKPGPYVMISASDTGVGMPPEIRDRIFEPFFTTKEKGRGTGLGLSTVYGIVKQSGGNIWVYSEPEKGTTFKIYLPRVDEPFEELKEKLVKEELPRGNETILIVEDEEDVLKLAGRILSRQGYHVLEALSGEEALRICKKEKEPFHLLLTDVVMPQMSGRQLEEQLSRVCQDFKVLYMSGYTDNAITHHGVLEKGLKYIQKPFTVDGLIRKIREVLDK
jgi:PAS domain S-box-containing protein